MFTSEPSLAQRIERMIAETPVIDPRSRIHCDQPNAPDLATLMSEPGIQAELHSVGMPRGDFAPALPPDERVRRSIPYLRRMRNTATAWCLFRIFRDLYDFGDAHLTESNYRDLVDRMEKTAKDTSWTSAVLRESCNIRAIVTDLSHRGDGPSEGPVDIVFRLDLHDLCSPGGATKGNYYDFLGVLLGERPATTERLGRLVHDWLDRTVTGRVRLASAFLPIERLFLPPDESHAQFVLQQAVDDWDLVPSDFEPLAQLITWQVLAWHHENHKTFQIGVLAEALAGGSKSIPRSLETWTSEIARTFLHFKRARFDLVVVPHLLAPDVATLARQFRNVYTSGDWSHNFTPATIERSFGLRIQTAPMSKIGGFLSDAGSVEWTYGKLLMVRKAMASALARQVEGGYYEEHEIPAILHQVLHDTPLNLYDLTPP